MNSWENGGIAPIYLCETHGMQISHLGSNVPAVRPQSVCSNSAAEHPESGARSDIALDREVESSYEAGRGPASIGPEPSAVLVADDANAGAATEDFEAHGMVLLCKSSAAPEKQVEHVDPERSCLSGFGERCAYESTVHCPKCGKWFCDTHAEDRTWHPCALST